MLTELARADGPPTEGFKGRPNVLFVVEIVAANAFIAERLAVWRNPQSEETLRFRRLYGDQHWKAVTAWFEQAGSEREARE